MKLRNIIILLFVTFFILILLVFIFSATIFLPVIKSYPIDNKGSMNNKDDNIFDTGLVIDQPKFDSQITSPVKISGYVNGDDWIAFEAQVGSVRLIDENNQELGFALLKAKGDWMQKKVYFETELHYTSQSDTTGKLVFYNENPSGEEWRNKNFVIPVKIKQNLTEMMKVKNYFNFVSDQVKYECENVIAIERIVPKNQAVAKIAIEELLNGLSEREKNQGYFTSINNNVKLNSLIIDSLGTAKADFNSELIRNIGGSCRVMSIKAQITETLKQFPSVKNVIISVDGQTEGILQP